MQSSIEKRVMRSGKGIVDEKLAQLSALDRSVSSGVDFSFKRKKQEGFDIVESEDSIAALECIDRIHESQNAKLNEGMPMLQSDLEYWAKYDKIPVQMEALLSLAIMDARKQQERIQNHLTENDFYTNKDVIKDLEKIKKRYNIEIDEDHFNSDPQLFKSFMSMDPRAFFNFKNNANISRTLVKNHFKPKVKTGMEKRKEEVIRQHDLETSNDETLKRLGKELIKMKPVNKTLYHQRRKDLDRVILAQKNGYQPDAVHELIKQLPESMLPDEQDIALAKTMQSYRSERNSSHREGDQQLDQSNLQREDSILSVGVDPTGKGFNLDSSRLINVTDFTSQQEGDQTERVKLGLSTLDKGSVQRTKNQYKSSVEQTRSRKREKRTIQDIKLAEMHMKRRVPQIFLSKDLKEGKRTNLNDFNHILKKSLLSPEKQRYVSTRHEQEELDRRTMSPSQRQAPAKLNIRPYETEQRGWSTSRQDNGVLPIISVGSSVDYQNLKQQDLGNHTQDSFKPPSEKRLRIGDRFRRGGEEIVDSKPQLLGKSLGMSSPAESGHSISAHQSLAGYAKNMRSDQGQVLSPSMRGVSPLIRGHVRSTSQEAGQNIFMTNLHQGESKSSIRNFSVIRSAKEVQSPIASSQNLKQEEKPKLKDIHDKGPSPHMQKVKEIINKVRAMRGSNPTSSALQSVNENVQKQMLQQMFRLNHVHETADQVQSFCEYQPKILNWLFDELQESLQEENETQRHAIEDFEKRKLDYKYFQMIENRERSNFNKQMNGKKKTD